MERRDEIIYFDEIDKQRYADLPDWLPIEAIPGLFEDIKKDQVALTLKIQRLNERKRSEVLEELRQAHLSAVQLQNVAEGLGELAGGALIESMLPASM